METLSHRLERNVVIQAAPETVFRYFTDTERWARWWGAGSTIEARAGGKVYIHYPEGTEALGEVLEIAPPERIVFTYGYASGKPIAPGGSRVTIRLEREEAGTRLLLVHEFDDAAVRDAHEQGWRYQLSVFANVVADEVYAGAAGVADAWFEAWAIADGAAREEAFGKIASAEVRFHDRFSMLDGVADLTAHAGAAQRFLPGVRMKRTGEIRHCQGAVLAEWVALGSDGKERMSGTNLFMLAPDGRIRSVTGFVNLPATK